MALLSSLGERLRRLREDQNLTLDVLARRSGLSVRFLSELLAGRANVSVVRLARVAEALGTTAGALLSAAESGAGGATPSLIALLGIRGAGKSAVGERLAGRLGLEFIELDRRIESEGGLTIPEIFSIHGEGYYRKLELSALQRLFDERRPAVLAVGGGIVTHAPAWNLLLEQATTVWLRATADDHWNRVMKQGDPRPMAGRPAAQAELRRLIAEREPLYRDAAIRIDTSRLDIEECVRVLAERLQPLVAPPAAASAPRRSAAGRRR